MSVDIDRYLHDELVGDLASERSADRHNAIIVLARLGRGAVTLETLRFLADTDPESDLRTLAREKYDEVFARVGREVVGDVSVVSGEPPQLDLEALHRYLGAENALQRLSALVAAARTGDARLLPVALARLDTETDDWVVATLVKCVGELGTAIHVPRVQRFLAHPTARVVANTVEAIATLDPQAGFSLLVPLLSSDDTRVRAAAVGAMIAVEKQAALDTLVAMARSSRRHARESAIHCLNRLQEPEAEKILCDMLLVEEEAALVAKLAECLGRRATSATLERLAPIVSREPNRANHAALAGVLTEVAARLGAAPDELARLEKGPIVGPPPPPEPIQPRRTRKTRSVAALAPPPPPPWRPSSYMVACGAVLLIAGGVVAYGVHSSSTGIPGLSRRDVAATPLADVARASAPNRFLNQVVRWEGTVDTVDRAGSNVQVSNGELVFSSTVAPGIARTLKPGDRVRVVGRVVGRSRLGPVYLVGLDAEKR